MQANETISFSEVQRLSQIAIEAGNLDKLQTLLVPLLREDDRSRSAEENLYLYRTLGDMYEEKGLEEDANKAFEKAYNFDCRDPKVLETRVMAELKKDAADVNADILLEHLVFHRNSIKNSLVMRIFKMLGEIRRAKGELDAAREYYEKALEARPGDMDIINSILSISEESGNDEALMATRQKLLSTLTNPDSRAAVLVSIGDDYIKANDEAAALEMYEEALVESSSSIAAHTRILVISEHKSDWERALAACNALVDAAQENDEKAKYLLKTAWIFKEKLNDIKDAVIYFNRVLDLQPNQFDVFKGLLQMLIAQKDYVGVEAAYERMIERQRALEPMNTQAVAQFCKNLGDVRLKELNNIRGACEAYQFVSDLMPENVNFHALLAKLYAQNDDTLDKAIRENREVLRLAPDHIDVVSAMADCYRRLGKYDEALCIYRVLAALNLINAEGNDIVERFQPDETPSLDRPFSEDQLKLIRPNTLDGALCAILRIASNALNQCFINDLSNYGISEKHNRVNVNEPTVFTRTLKNVQKALNFAELPNIYRWDAKSGIINGYLEERSFLVHSNLLGGRDEHEVTFATAKALLLMRPEFYLLQKGRVTLELIIYTIFKVACPQLNIDLNRDQLKLAKALERGLKSEELAQIAKIVNRIMERKQKINIMLFIESVEDYANRIGLIFCDDPRVIKSLLSEEEVSISRRSPDERLGSLLVWALSEDYANLRKDLGINIQV